ncbi:MAG: phosphoenolpyruvate--protein phosphotransferase [Clostridia bacterium]|nr:phosphoenolpyruvate--protein phosphotransferase [Clostridia bacterium]
MANKKSTIVQGIGITNKRVSGRLHFLKKQTTQSKKRSTYNVGTELLRLEEAKKNAIERVWEIEKRAKEITGSSEAQIFEIHAMLLEDEDLNDAIITEIKNGKCAEEAIEIASEKYSKMLIDLGDEYLSARASDIKDISSQLIKALDKDSKRDGQENSTSYILVADDLTPSETVLLDKSKILAIVTFGGTPSSHTAILARSMGIPALVGTGRIEAGLDGHLALLDSVEGSLIIDPTDSQAEDFERVRAKENKIATEHERYLRSLINKPAVTRSGHKVMIYANIGNENEISGALSNGAEGIGLLRSEFMYLERQDYPTEEELFSTYRDVAIKMGGRRVIIRTLDVGADKQISYLDIPAEENPAMGFRGIRVCLERRDMFKNQIRAILRASYYGRVSIMLPMVVCEKEILTCKTLIEECKAELSERKLPYDSKIELGIMIETPASAIISDKLARLVDFFSVGTNDLSQYTLAVDRQNSKVASLCEDNYEPVLRLIKMSAKSIHENGGWIGVCGEMAADLSLTEELVKIGVDELSVSVPYLLGVRGKVSECR